MAIALALSGTSGSITTYGGLVEAVSDWLKDPSLEDYVPTFIQLAEAHFRRTITHADREGISSASLTGESISLPTDFLAARAVFLDNDPRQPLEPMSPGALRTFWAGQGTGLPRNYSIIDGAMYFGPAPDSTYTVNMTYARDLTPLSQSTSSNWLLEIAPDAYLFATLVHAELYGWNDERLPVLKSALDEMIADLNGQGIRQKYSGPMRLRAAVVEVI